MDEQSILQFCKERNVEIYTCYDFRIECYVIKMRRGQSAIEWRIDRGESVKLGFGLTVRIILRRMADERDRAEKAENKGKER